MKLMFSHKPAWLKGLNVILISEFMNSEIRIPSNNVVELILISEITNPEIRISSTLRYFARQAARLSFQKKNSNVCECTLTKGERE